MHLSAALIRHGRIKTTLAKAKSLRPVVEKMVTRAKIGSLANRRQLQAKLGQISTVERLIKEIAPRYTTRPGGYTRIVKLPARSGDASPMALIEFV